jgi:hypothetical protein
MIYNCVEHAVRESLSNLRKDIASDCERLGQLREFWQEDVVRVKLSEKLRQGMNNGQLLKDIVELTNADISWENSKRDLTFAGNVDHIQLIRLARGLRSDWRPPKGTLGGNELQLVRQMRNDLAHGEDTFENVGDNFDTATMIQQFERIRKFVVSFLSMLERYRTQKRYLR